MEDVKISPDGSQLAFAKTSDNDERVVAVVSLADGRVAGTVRVGDAKLRWIRWIDEKHLLLATSTTAVPFGMLGSPDEWLMLQMYDVSRNETSPVLRGIDHRTMNVAWQHQQLMVRRLDGRSVLFVGGFYATDRLVPALYRVDVETGREELIQKGSSSTRGWLVDAAGQIVADCEYRESEQRSIFRIRLDGELRETASEPDRFDQAGLVGFSADGESIVAGAPEGDDSILKPLSLRDGTMGAPIGRALLHGRELEGPIADRLANRIVGTIGVDGARTYKFFDPTLQKDWDAILSSFPGERVRFLSMSDDRSKLVLLVEHRHAGPTYELFDAREGTVRTVGHLYGNLPEVAEVRVLPYRAADGVAIPAFLTLPSNRPTKHLPLIVLPHGGPASRDDGGYDWWAQGLAAQGYAVLQPNFRGSTFNSQLFAAGSGEFGRKMQKDLSDGVRYLASLEIIDPTRVCIVGASYGGYAALAGVTLESGVYRCAVSVAGISDLERMLKWIRQRERHEDSTQRYWDRFLGVTSADDPLVAALSPINHIESVSVPILLIHGRDDTVVPYEQSEGMARALERSGKTVELVPLNGEDHWLSRSSTRKEMLERTVDFLKAHNPPGS
jgi:dipeptidyl aminopeptidase/acylaminoacyl peptidase